MDHRSLLPYLERLDASGDNSIPENLFRKLLDNPTGVHFATNLLDLFWVPEEWGTHNPNKSVLRDCKIVRDIYAESETELMVATRIKGVHTIIKVKAGLEARKLNNDMPGWRLEFEERLNPNGTKIFILGRMSDDQDPLVYVTVSDEDGHTNVLGECHHLLFVGHREQNIGQKPLLLWKDTYPLGSANPEALELTKKKPHEVHRTLFVDHLITGFVAESFPEPKYKDLSWLRLNFSHPVPADQVNSQRFAWQEECIFVDLDSAWRRSSCRWVVGHKPKPEPWFERVSPIFEMRHRNGYGYWGFLSFPKPMLCLMQIDKI